MKVYSKKEVKSAVRATLDQVAFVAVPGFFDLDDDIFVKAVIGHLTGNDKKIIPTERLNLEGDR